MWTLSLIVLLVATIIPLGTAYTSIPSSKSRVNLQSSTSPAFTSCSNHQHRTVAKRTLYAAATPRNDESPQRENTNNEENTNSQTTPPDENWLQRTVRQLAQLSLQDYKWRSDVFKEKEADRMLEQSLARVRGEEPGYVRPMDASESSLGPLGKWEKSAVEWLSQVIDEEGRRAERIVSGDGRLVRPKDAEEEELGPLGFLEKKASDFLQSIQTAEKERIKTKTLRPKDVDEAVRGPLGEAELQAVRILKDIQESEKMRMTQSQRRGGALVRPIDVPGPLGEFELSVLELFDAEQKRARERKSNNLQFVRPKDAKYKGPLGQAEQQAYETIQKLSQEEKKRLESIQRILREKRPMENDSKSVLGVLETFLVGLVRAPVMLVSVFDRVRELLSSEELEETDKVFLKDRTQKKSPPASGGADKNSSR